MSVYVIGQGTSTYQNLALLVFSVYFSVINCFLCAFRVIQPSGSNEINISVFLFRAPAGFGFVLVGGCPLEQIKLHTLYTHALILANFCH